jgi:hypothetical protein
VHPSRESTLLEAEDLRIEPELEVENYLDAFGNRFSRLQAPAGIVRLLNQAIIHDTGEPDAYAPNAALAVQRGRASTTFVRRSNPDSTSINYPKSTVEHRFSPCK